MKKLVVLAFLAWTSNTYAEPPWFLPNIKKSDCEGLSLSETEKCLSSYHDQQLTKLRDHFLRTVTNLDNEQAGGCDRSELLRIYRTREEAWDAYESASCELQCHCVGPCGSGHSTCYRGCLGPQKRVTFLTNEMASGLSIWGCPISLLERTKTLHTPGFEITLTATCKLGFFDCEEVRYQGTSRRTGESLQLLGKRIRTCGWTEPPCVWNGYEFENKGILYRIEESGALQVSQIEDGAVLVSEAGVWE